LQRHCAPFFMSRRHARLGEDERAIQALEQSFNRRTVRVASELQIIVEYGRAPLRRGTAGRVTRHLGGRSRHPALTRPGAVMSLEQ
jgi:hypothetical protein